MTFFSRIVKTSTSKIFALNLTHVILSERELLLLEAINEIRATQRQHGVLLTAIMNRQQLDMQVVQPITETFNLPLSSCADAHRLEELLSDKATLKSLVRILG